MVNRGSSEDIASDEVCSGETNPPVPDEPHDDLNERISPSPSPSVEDGQQLTPTVEDKDKRPGCRKLLCLYCERTFLSATLRQKHVERCHGAGGGPRRHSSRTGGTAAQTGCCYCAGLNGREHSLDELFAHLLSEHRVKYHGCMECRERYSNLEALTKHKTEVHGENPAPTPMPSPAVSVTAKPVQKRNEKGRFLPREQQATVATTSVTNVADSRPETSKKSNNTTRMQQIIRRKLRKRRFNIIQNDVRTTRSAAKKLEKQLKRAPRPKKSDEYTAQQQEILNNRYYPFTVPKIHDHTIDSIRLDSVTFDAVFDSEFFSRTVSNIRENLLHHLDGKLNMNAESETRISNFETSSNFGCDLTLNAATPVVASAPTAHYSLDLDSQIEYGSKAASKCKKFSGGEGGTHKHSYATRKFNFSLSKREDQTDMSKLDMWTQLRIKNRQAKIRKSPEPNSAAKLQFEELNRIIEKRGPFEDLRQEADSIDRPGQARHDVKMILEDLLEEVLEKCEAVPSEETPKKMPPIKHRNLEVPNYLNLKKSNKNYLDQGLDRSDRITLICSSQEVEYVGETEVKREIVELSGEWARPRIYICATCGLKLPNIKLLDEHKALDHPHIWSQHYEFVGNPTGGLYRHLNIPGLGTVASLEEGSSSRLWRKSGARLCTKCQKQCNSLPELHRHMLECGGDWTWMLVRKKYKYRPCGSRSRRRRLRGYKRIIYENGEEANEIRAVEPKTYNKTKPSGPRQRPSDAETIQRMLANLPAKRATRKIVCMRDGIQRPRKTCLPTVETQRPVEVKRTITSGLRTKRRLVHLSRELRLLRQAAGSEMMISESQDLERPSVAARRQMINRRRHKHELQEQMRTKTRASQRKKKEAELAQAAQVKTEAEPNEDVKEIPKNIPLLPETQLVESTESAVPVTVKEEPDTEQASTSKSKKEKLTQQSDSTKPAEVKPTEKKRKRTPVKSTVKKTKQTEPKKRPDKKEKSQVPEQQAANSSQNQAPEQNAQKSFSLESKLPELFTPTDFLGLCSSNDESDPPSATLSQTPHSGSVNTASVTNPTTPIATCTTPTSNPTTPTATTPTTTSSSSLDIVDELRTKTTCDRAAAPAAAKGKPKKGLNDCIAMLTTKLHLSPGGGRSESSVEGNQSQSGCLVSPSSSGEDKAHRRKPENVRKNERVSSTPQSTSHSIDQVIEDVIRKSAEMSPESPKESKPQLQLLEQQESSQQQQPQHQQQPHQQQPRQQQFLQQQQPHPHQELLQVQQTNPAPATLSEKKPKKTKKKKLNLDNIYASVSLLTPQMIADLEKREEQTPSQPTVHEEELTQLLVQVAPSDELTVEKSEQRPGRAPRKQKHVFKTVAEPGLLAIASVQIVPPICVVPLIVPQKLVQDEEKALDLTVRSSKTSTDSVDVPSNPLDLSCQSVSTVTDSVSTVQKLKGVRKPAKKKSIDQEEQALDLSIDAKHAPKSLEIEEAVLDLSIKSGTKNIETQVQSVSEAIVTETPSESVKTPDIGLPAQSKSPKKPRSRKSSSKQNENEQAPVVEANTALASQLIDIEEEITATQILKVPASNEAEDTPKSEKLEEEKLPKKKPRSKSENVKSTKKDSELPSVATTESVETDPPTKISKQSRKGRQSVQKEPNVTSKTKSPRRKKALETENIPTQQVIDVKQNSRRRSVAIDKEAQSEISTEETNSELPVLKPNKTLEVQEKEEVTSETLQPKRKPKINKKKMAKENAKKTVVENVEIAVEEIIKEPVAEKVDGKHDEVVEKSKDNDDKEQFQLNDTFSIVKRGRNRKSITEQQPATSKEPESTVGCVKELAAANLTEFEDVFSLVKRGRRNQKSKTDDDAEVVKQEVSTIKRGRKSTKNQSSTVSKISEEIQPNTTVVSNDPAIITEKENEIVTEAAETQDNKKRGRKANQKLTSNLSKVPETEPQIAVPDSSEDSKDQAAATLDVTRQNIDANEEKGENVELTVQTKKAKQPKKRGKKQRKLSLENAGASNIRKNEPDTQEIPIVLENSDTKPTETQVIASTDIVKETIENEEEKSTAENAIPEVGTKRPKRRGKSTKLPESEKSKDAAVLIPEPIKTDENVNKTLEKEELDASIEVLVDTTPKSPRKRGGKSKIEKLEVAETVAETLLEETTKIDKESIEIVDKESFSENAPGKTRIKNSKKRSKKSKTAEPEKSIDNSKEQSEESEKLKQQNEKLSKPNEDLKKLDELEKETTAEKPEESSKNPDMSSSECTTATETIKNNLNIVPGTDQESIVPATSLKTALKGGRKLNKRSKRRSVQSITVERLSDESQITPQTDVNRAETLLSDDSLVKDSLLDSKAVETLSADISKSKEPIDDRKESSIDLADKIEPKKPGRKSKRSLTRKTTEPVEQEVFPLESSNSETIPGVNKEAVLEIPVGTSESQISIEKDAGKSEQNIIVAEEPIKRRGRKSKQKQTEISEIEAKASLEESKEEAGNEVQLKSSLEIADVLNESKDIKKRGRKSKQKTTKTADETALTDSVAITKPPENIQLEKEETVLPPPEETTIIESEVAAENLITPPQDNKMQEGPFKEVNKRGRKVKKVVRKVGGQEPSNQADTYSSTQTENVESEVILSKSDEVIIAPAEVKSLDEEKEITHVEVTPNDVKKRGRNSKKKSLDRKNLRQPNNQIVEDNPSENLEATIPKVLPIPESTETENEVVENVKTIEPKRRGRKTKQNVDDSSLEKPVEQKDNKLEVSPSDIQDSENLFNSNIVEKIRVVRKSKRKLSLDSASTDTESKETLTVEKNFSSSSENLSIQSLEKELASSVASKAEDVLTHKKQPNRKSKRNIKDTKKVKLDENSEQIEAVDNKEENIEVKPSEADLVAKDSHITDNVESIENPTFNAALNVQEIPVEGAKQVASQKQKKSRKKKTKDEQESMKSESSEILDGYLAHERLVQKLLTDVADAIEKSTSSVETEKVQEPAKITMKIKRGKKKKTSSVVNAQNAEAEKEKVDASIGTPAKIEPEIEIQENVSASLDQETKVDAVENDKNTDSEGFILVVSKKRKNSKIKRKLRAEESLDSNNLPEVSDSKLNEATTSQGEIEPLETKTQKEVVIKKSIFDDEAIDFESDMFEKVKRGRKSRQNTATTETLAIVDNKKTKKPKKSLNESASLETLEANKNQPDLLQISEGAIESTKTLKKGKRKVSKNIVAKEMESASPEQETTINANELSTTEPASEPIASTDISINQPTSNTKALGKKGRKARTPKKSKVSGETHILVPDTEDLLKEIDDVISDSIEFSSSAQNTSEVSLLLDESLTPSKKVLRERRPKTIEIFGNVGDKLEDTSSSTVLDSSLEKTPKKRNTRKKDKVPLETDLIDEKRKDSITEAIPPAEDNPFNTEGLDLDTKLDELFGFNLKPLSDSKESSVQQPETISESLVPFDENFKLPFEPRSQPVLFTENLQESPATKRRGGRKRKIRKSVESLSDAQSLSEADSLSSISTRQTGKVDITSILDDFMSDENESESKCVNELLKSIDNDIEDSMSLNKSKELELESRSEKERTSNSLLFDSLLTNSQQVSVSSEKHFEESVQTVENDSKTENIDGLSTQEKPAIKKGKKQNRSGSKKRNKPTGKSIEKSLKGDINSKETKGAASLPEKLDLFDILRQEGNVRLLPTEKQSDGLKDVYEFDEFEEDKELNKTAGEYHLSKVKPTTDSVIETLLDTPESLVDTFSDSVETIAKKKDGKKKSRKRKQPVITRKDSSSSFDGSENLPLKELVETVKNEDLQDLEKDEKLSVEDNTSKALENSSAAIKRPRTNIKKKTARKSKKVIDKSDTVDKNLEVNSNENVGGDDTNEGNADTKDTPLKQDRYFITHSDESSEDVPLIKLVETQTETTFNGLIQEHQEFESNLEEKATNQVPDITDDDANETIEQVMPEEKQNFEEIPEEHSENLQKESLSIEPYDSDDDLPLAKIKEQSNESQPQLISIKKSSAKAKLRRKLNNIWPRIRRKKRINKAALHVIASEIVNCEVEKPESKLGSFESITNNTIITKETTDDDQKVDDNATLNKSDDQQDAESLQKVGGRKNRRIKGSLNLNRKKSTKSTGSDEEEAFCDICGKAFLSLDRLAKHKRTLRHISKLSEIEAEQNLRNRKSPSPVHNAEKLNICSVDEVDKTFKEVISEVLNKPIFIDPTRKYKSLGERKSFDSDHTMPPSVPPKFEEFSASSPLDTLKPTTELLERQLLLLENIVEEEKRPSSIPQNDNMESTSCSNSSNFEMDYSNKDQLSRKILNRDEALFLECCSLLKSAPESNKNEEKHNFMEEKSLTDNARAEGPRDTPSFVDGSLWSNSSCSEWFWQQKQQAIHDVPVISNAKQEHRNFQFDSINENIILDSKNDERSFELGEQDDRIEKRRKSVDFSDDLSDCEEQQLDAIRNMLDQNEPVPAEGVDEELKKRMVNAFGGLMAKALGSRLHSVVQKGPKLKLSKSQKRRLKEAVPPSIEQDMKSENSGSETDGTPRKTLMTKGALKVFEGIRVSIPTDELNLEEVLKCSPKVVENLHRSPKDTEKSGIIDDIVERPRKIFKKTNKIEKAKSLFRKFGNKLGMKETKRFSVNKLRKSRKKQSNNKKHHSDVYDFEESQDEGFTNFRSFKDNIHTDTPAFEKDELALNKSNSSSETEEKLSPKLKNEKKKCMIMGRIFKNNALKSKADDSGGQEFELEDEEDNSGLMEKYLESCSKSKNISVEDEEEIDAIFDSLIKEGDEAAGEMRKSHNKHSKKQKIGKKRARKGSISDPSDDEFIIKGKNVRKSRKPKDEDEESTLNLELEIKECIGVAGRKSQRKCTSGKQNVLVEYWTSDESSTEKDNKGPKTPSTDRPAKPKKRNPTKKSQPTENEAIIPPKLNISTPTMEKPDTKLEVTVTDGVASRRNKRSASEMLYYWSSSSDEGGDNENIADPREVENVDEEDKPVHGWIVGDSPKKLVTMLAQAKGKGTESKSKKSKT